MEVWKLAVAALVVGAMLPVTVQADACNPYPIGRCGEEDREHVVFCYRMVGNRMVDATDRHVVALATSEGVALPDNNAKGVLYVRLGPTETFMEDPYESDLPVGTLVLETNTVRGVQLKPFVCGTFIWFAECDSWMGPYNVQPRDAPSFPIDRVVV